MVADRGHSIAVRNTTDGGVGGERPRGHGEKKTKPKKKKNPKQPHQTKTKPTTPKTQTNPQILWEAKGTLAPCATENYEDIQFFWERRERMAKEKK